MACFFCVCVNVISFLFKVSYRGITLVSVGITLVSVRMQDLSVLLHQSNI